MSLQVWLPLNGNLNNQGLIGGVAENRDATVDNAGKIGKCYSFQGNSSGAQFLLMQNVLSSTTPNFSIAFWVKFNNTNSTGCLYSARTVVGSGIALFRLNTNVFRLDDGSLQTTFSSYNTTTEWTHVCVTRSTTAKSLYINGELKQTVSSVGNLADIYNGKGSIGISTVSEGSYGNYLNGKLNDFRIYDHCLSPKEVKEIAKGLCLHYKLTFHILDAEYIQLGYDNTIEYDHSGFGNNGTKTTDITYNTTSPRYPTSYHFTTAQNITCSTNPSFITAGTLSFWRKADATSQAWLPLNGLADNSAYIMATNGGNNFWHGKVSGTLIIYQDGNVVTAPTNDGKWHHYVITGMNLSQWDRLKINTHTNYNNPGCYSDFRIYATVLTASDVLELYNSAANIDNTGKAYTYEFIER